MYRALLSIILALALTAPALAKKEPVVDGALLKYGMAQAEAEKVIADKAFWQVAYRVDTASTSEIACVWDHSVFYKVKFFEGKCYFIEKRAIVSRDEIDTLLQMYRGAYGDTPEATSDHQGRLIFSRWTMTNREVTINAMRLKDGRYKLFYEEFDPVEIGAARRAQEAELGEGGNMDVDPITGRPRITPMGPSAYTGEDEAEAETADAEPAGEPEAEAEETPQPATDEDAAADDSAAPDDEPEPRKRHDPEEW
jgi:hypothetical protein